MIEMAREMALARESASGSDEAKSYFHTYPTHSPVPTVHQRFAAKIMMYEYMTRVPATLAKEWYNSPCGRIRPLG